MGANNCGFLFRSRSITNNTSVTESLTLLLSASVKKMIFFTEFDKVLFVSASGHLIIRFRDLVKCT